MVSSERYRRSVVIPHIPGHVRRSLVATSSDRPEGARVRAAGGTDEPVVLRKPVRASHTAVRAVERVGSPGHQVVGDVNIAVAGRIGDHTRGPIDCFDRVVDDIDEPSVVDLASARRTSVQVVRHLQPVSVTDATKERVDPRVLNGYTLIRIESVLTAGDLV